MLCNMVVQRSCGLLWAKQKHVRTHVNNDSDRWCCWSKICISRAKTVRAIGELIEMNTLLLLRKNKIVRVVESEALPKSKMLSHFDVKISHKAGKEQEKAEPEKKIWVGTVPKSPTVRTHLRFVPCSHGKDPMLLRLGKDRRLSSVQHNSQPNMRLSSQATDMAVHNSVSLVRPRRAVGCPVSGEVATARVSFVRAKTEMGNQSLSTINGSLK